MSKKTLVRKELSGNQNTYRLDPPCTYCGKPADPESIKRLDTEYQLKAWAINRYNGQSTFVNVLDSSKEPLKGHVLLELPYCREHMDKPQIVRILNIIGTVLGITAGIAMFIFYIKDIDPSENPLVQGLLRFFASVFGGFLLFLLVRSIQWIVGIVKKELLDFPLFGGHWGVETSVKVDQGKLGEGPITYTLHVRLANYESARRLVEKHDGFYM